MAIVDPASLIITVDRLGEAIFRGQPWKQEARAVRDWLTSRLGRPGAYAGSFALTDGDWAREFRVFTGEKITTRAGRAHVVAEETMRVLAIIRRRTGLGCPALERSEERLGERIFRHEGGTAPRDGMYCCAKCSIAFWRCLAAGGYSGHRGTLRRGLRTLARHRDGRGGWRRFPFYYTLSLLAEMEPGLPAGEIRYCSQRFASLQRALEGRSDRYSRRRLEIINRLAAAARIG